MGQSRRAFDSGFVGELSWSSKWNRWKMDIRRRGSSAFEKWEKMRFCSHVQTHRGQTLSQPRHNFSHVEAKAPNTKCFHHWATDVLVWCVREKWPSTSAFFLPPFQDNCWDLILMLFCVVLYFHAKILLYLNVFILLNVLIFLVIIP